MTQLPKPLAMTPPILVLTIDAPNGARRRHCAEEFARVGMKFDFVEGVRTDSPELPGLYSRWRNLVFAKRSMTGGEIAAYFGHRKAWRQFVDSGAPVGLIAEDDLAILDQAAFRTVMENATDTAGWNVLKLFDFRPKPSVGSRDWHGLTLVQYKYPASGNVAYLLTRQAAQDLLARRRVFRPVDEDFSHPWEFGLRVCSLCPNIVAEISETIGGSHLEGGRSAAKRGKNRIRSLWGMVLQARKQLRARAYRNGGAQ
jgi:GR25 family glycosyltransferase involved in LPS biosynthesis